MAEYFDRAGQPLTMEEWAKDYADNSVLQTTDIDEEVSVSTIWLGLNHQYGDGPPLIFETVVFGGGTKCPTCGHREGGDPMYRYSTELAAKEHHHALVAALRAGEPLPEPLESSDD
jgi:hypothetical protein